MNREQKYKAWDGSKFVLVAILEWVPADKSFNGRDGYNINTNLGIPLENLQQFTSLQDSTGKDIYCGDILAEEGQPLPLEVKQQPSGLWVAESPGVYCDYVLNIASKSRVIGNVLELDRTIV